MILMPTCEVFAQASRALVDKPGNEVPLPLEVVVGFSLGTERGRLLLRALLVVVLGRQSARQFHAARCGRAILGNDKQYE